ncbi:MAG: hypothetical protein H0U46_03830 [Actinobacteria bacterium]|nr:hypothetical protein [Actinomycetota bacterium]
MKEGIVERVLGPNGEVAEIIVKAPIAEMRLAAAEAGFDPPSEGEVAEVAMRVAQEEYDEAAKQKLAGSTIATVALGLAYAIYADVDVRARSRGIDGLEVRIPREIVERVTGAKLAISETADGDVILRWRERAERPIEPEEMRA